MSAVIDHDACGVTKGCFRYPRGCDGPDCRYVVTYAVDVDNDRVTMEMMGISEGYITMAIGEGIHMVRYAGHSLQWGHNRRDGVSNHQYLDCLLNRLFRHRWKKTPKSTSLAFVRGIHRWPVNSPHKGPVTRKMFSFNDVIIYWECATSFILNLFFRKHKDMFVSPPFLNTEIAHHSILVEDQDLFIVHFQYRCCLWPEDSRSQALAVLVLT